MPAICKMMHSTSMTPILYIWFVASKLRWQPRRHELAEEVVQKIVNKSLRHFDTKLPRNEASASSLKWSFMTHLGATWQAYCLCLHIHECNICIHMKGLQVIATWLLLQWIIIPTTQIKDDLSSSFALWLDGLERCIGAAKQKSKTNTEVLETEHLRFDQGTLEVWSRLQWIQYQWIPIAVYVDKKNIDCSKREGKWKVQSEYLYKLLDRNEVASSPSPI